MTVDGTTGQVALLVDFENLVRAVDEEDIDCEAVFRLADEYGRVLVANAYADWRLKDVNQYQTDLYALGIELVHVLGRRHGALVKNAVDVKMAVDAVSFISSPDGCEVGQGHSEPDVREHRRRTVRTRSAAGSLGHPDDHHGRRSACRRVLGR